MKTRVGRASAERTALDYILEPVTRSFAGAGARLLLAAGAGEAARDRLQAVVQRRPFRRRSADPRFHTAWALHGNLVNPGLFRPGASCNSVTRPGRAASA